VRGYDGTLEAIDAARERDASSPADREAEPYVAATYPVTIEQRQVVVDVPE